MAAAAPSTATAPAANGKTLRRFLAASGISITGDGMFMTAGPLLAAALTRDPLEVSLVAAAQPLAWVLAGIPAGSTADRRPRRLVMICAWLASALVFGLLALLLQAGAADISVLAAVALAAGAVACYGNTASAAVIPDLFTRDKQTLARVNKWYWSLDSVCRSIAGPLLGAAAFAASRALPFAADAVSFAVAAAIARGLPRAAAPSPAPARAEEGLPGSAGLRHVLEASELRAVVLGTGLYNFACNTADGVLVLYAREVLGVSAAWYGALMTAVAFGAVAGGWRGSRLASRLSYRRAVAACTSVQAAAWAVTVACASIWVTAVCLAVIGAASVVITVAGTNAIQQLAPPALLGRVTAVYMILASGSAGLGAVAGGLVAAGAGLRSALITASAIAAVAGAVLWLRAASPAAGADRPARQRLRPVPSRRRRCRRCRQIALGRRARITTVSRWSSARMVVASRPPARRARAAATSSGPGGLKLSAPNIDRQTSTLAAGRSAR